MNCLDARRELLADPERPSAELGAHLSECAACAAAAERAREQDERIREALKVPVPKGLADRLLLAQTTKRRSRVRHLPFALAATVVLSVSVAIAWQFGVRPWSEARALERYVLEHIRHEQQALSLIDRVPRDAVVALLSEYDLELAGTMDDIVFLKRCPTPNGDGLHFVVRTDRGPVTIIYMPEQSLAGRVEIESPEHSGYVTRFHRGAMALVGTPGQSLQQVAAQVTAALIPSEG